MLFTFKERRGDDGPQVTDTRGMSKRHSTKRAAVSTLSQSVTLQDGAYVKQNRVRTKLMPSKTNRLQKRGTKLHAMFRRLQQVEHAGM